jgi:hypothetical protein
MTPLTARAFAGYVTLVGLLQVSMAKENDWPRVKIATLLFMALPIAVLFQLARFSDEVDWSNAALWLFLADIAATGAICVWLWAKSNSTAR